MELRENLSNATEELSEVLADLDLSDEEIIEVLPTIRERIEIAQKNLLEIEKFYKT